VFFNAGCNEQVFSSKSEKKTLAQIRLVVLEKNAKKTHPLIPKNDVVSGSLKLSFNLLTAFSLLIRVT